MHFLLPQNETSSFRFFVVRWFNFEEPLHNLWTQDQPALGVRNFRVKELFSGE